MIGVGRSTVFDRAARLVGSFLVVGCLVVGCGGSQAAPQVSVEDQAAAERALLSVSGGELPTTAAEPCSEVVAFDHRVDVGDGVRLHVMERFVEAAKSRGQKRALLMLTGTLVTGAQYDLEVGDETLNALSQAAKAGYFAYALTYEGYEGSTSPEDGRSVTAERTLEQVGRIVTWIRERRGVAQVDLLGSSLGSSLAIALASDESPIDRAHVGKLVLQSLVYKDVTPAFKRQLFAPQVRQALQRAPEGYIETQPEQYGMILKATDPKAAKFGSEHFPGRYATGPTLEGFKLPVFDVSSAKADVLQFWGDQDPITPFTDVTTFQAEYGGKAKVRVLKGAGHAPYLGVREVRSEFWDQTFAFLNEGRSGPAVSCR